MKILPNTPILTIEQQLKIFPRNPQLMASNACPTFAHTPQFTRVHISPILLHIPASNTERGTHIFAHIPVFNTDSGEQIEGIKPRLHPEHGLAIEPNAFTPEQQLPYEHIEPHNEQQFAGLIRDIMGGECASAHDKHDIRLVGLQHDKQFAHDTQFPHDRHVPHNVPQFGILHREQIGGHVPDSWAGIDPNTKYQQSKTEHGIQFNMLKHDWQFAPQ